MLTKEQQKVAEQALPLVKVCIASFSRAYPCLRKVAACCDLEGAAYLAVRRAAKTYNPDKAGISAYFSIAIRNAMLQEVQREMRTQAHSIRRIPLEQVNAREPPKEGQPAVALAALLELTEEERDWIERWVFDGTSFRAFGRESGRDPRTAKKILKARLMKLKDRIEDQP